MMALLELLLENIQRILHVSEECEVPGHFFQRQDLISRASVI